MCLTKIEIIIKTIEQLLILERKISKEEKAFQDK